METTGTTGTVREAAGNVKQTVGPVMDDTGMRIDGAVDELRGKAQQLCADATDLAREAMASRPLAVLAGAALVGFLTGAVWAPRRGSRA